MGITGIITLVVAAGVLIGLIKDVVTPSKKLTEKNNVQSLPAGYINHEQAQIIKDKPRAGYDTAPLGVEKSKTSQNMALGLGKVATGVVAGLAGFAGGAQVAALAKKGMKIAQKGVGIANNKLGVTRKINGVAWLAKGMKYKVADKVSLAKNTIANSKLGKGASKVIRGVKKATKPNVDALKAGLTLAASGVTGRTYKAQKEQFAKIKQLKEQAREENRKRSQIKRSAYESIMADKKAFEDRVIGDYNNYVKAKKRQLRDMAATGYNKHTAQNFKNNIDRHKKMADDLINQFDDNANRMYNQRVENALKAANLRGYSKGNSGLTKIGAAITAGGAATAGYIAGKLSGKKGTANYRGANINGAGTQVVHNTTTPIVNNHTTEVVINDNVIEANQHARYVATGLNMQWKIDDRKQAFKEARNYNFTSKQAVQYSNLKGKAEYTRAQQIENGVKKPLDVKEISKYFASAIKQNSNMSSEDMFKAIQEAAQMQKENEFKLENRARKQADYTVNVNQQAKEALNKILESSSETREILAKALQENAEYAISDERLKELEKQAKEKGKNIEELKLKETEEKIKQIGPELAEKVVTAVKNSEHSEQVREFLGEEGYKEFEKNVRKIIQANNEDFAKRMKKIDERLDQEFIKANKDIHPEYADLAQDDLRSIRKESDRSKYVKRAMEKVQKEMGVEQEYNTIASLITDKEPINDYNEYLSRTTVGKKAV